MAVRVAEHLNSMARVLDWPAFEQRGRGQMRTCLALAAFEVRRELGRQTYDAMPLPPPP